MSFPEFENPEDFENLANWVRQQLDNPDFVESVNRTIIIHSVSDGQQVYKVEEIEDAEAERLAVQKEGFVFESDNICYILGQGLRKVTNNFKSSGSFRITGELVSDFVDSYLYEAAKNGWDPNKVSVAAEAITTGAICSQFNIPFASYQTDITVSGQGLQAETYYLDVQFRPIPKNLKLVD